MNTTAATLFAISASRFLSALTRCNDSGQQRAEQAHQQDALGRTEVAAVHPGARRRPPTVDDALAAVLGARSPASAARRRRASAGCIRGWTTTRTSAMTIRTGTIALNAAAGSCSSSSAPVTEPTQRRRRQQPDPAPLPGQLGAGSPSVPLTAAEDHADVVGDVGADGRVAERQQGREGDQRARPDDRVDRAGGDCRPGRWRRSPQADTGADYLRPSAGPVKGRRRMSTTERARPSCAASACSPP